MNSEKGTIIDLQTRVAESSRSALDSILCEGAQRMLQAAIEFEVAEYIEGCKHLTDAAGRRLVVRNGFLPERDILTGAGPLLVTKPRVHDRRDGHSFTSKILPPYFQKRR